MTKLRNRHFLLSDVLLLPLAVYISYILRLESISPASRWWTGMVVFAISLTLSTVIVFYFVGVYSRFWRYASVDELILLTGAFTVSTLIAAFVAIGAGFVLNQRLSIPRSIPFIVLLLGLVVTAGPRLSVRIWTRRSKRNRKRAKSVRPVLIMGAGDTGAALAQEIQNNPQLGLEVVGFLDDDVRKHNAVIHGIPVLGNRGAIPSLAKTLNIKQIIIAMPTASGKEIRGVLRICEDVHVQTRTVPGTPGLLDGRVSISQVREVRIDDLLRREPITTDLAAVHDLLAGRRVLITGGGGSIGSELARQVYDCRPEVLGLLGHGENSIFSVFHELSDRSRSADGSFGVALRPIIADIRSEAQMNSVLSELRPDIVFHAAAHKHVPLMELNPDEAVLNNVGGTRCLLDAAVRHGVDRFVMISTDKAVNPTSVMGATKRVAELLVRNAAARSGKTYVTVRFGNVLGSRGSVVPTFQRQIANGGPVTVTHPDVQRFFMTVPEAVQLVLQASVLGKGGDLFMLDMGEPVKIVDLATDLIHLSGLEVDRDIDIVFSGLRPGEKMFEELAMPSESFARTRHDQIFIAENGVYSDSALLDGNINTLMEAANCSDVDSVYAMLHTLVPEYGRADDRLEPPESGRLRPVSEHE
ncbi:MAG: polysaccharide biosynthesis protein [Caldilineaceae bacterium]